MLKWRLLTALCLIPLVILGILRLGTIPFAFLSAAILMIGAHEWTALCPFPKRIHQFIYMALFAAILFGLFLAQSTIILWVSFVFWVLTGIGLIQFKGRPPAWLNRPLVKGLAGLLVLSSTFYGLNVLREQNNGAKWLIVCLILIWSTDTFAYFTGRLIGKRPLAPLISPKKTVEGFWGGFIGTLVLALGLYAANLLPSESMGLGVLLALTVGTILLAVIGDLFESVMKRLAGVKDSGKLLPGHGGILDRLDSLFAVVPFFALMIIWLQRGL
jgi:phosphatidate cytidylyltransferase